MRRARIGVLVGDARLTVVALAADRVEHFVVADSPDPGAALAVLLETRRLAGRLRVGLDRRHALVKIIRLPRAGGADVGRMLGFDVERHVPFAPDSIRFDWLELPGDSAEPRPVLLAAVDARTVERSLGLVSAARRRPAALTVACHALPVLLRRPRPAGRAVWAHRHGGAVDLLLLDGHTLRQSRRADAADAPALAREAARTLPIAGWAAPVELWISGDDAAAWRAALSQSWEAPVSEPPYAVARIRQIAALPASDAGAALLALAVAAAPRRPALDFLPAGERPWAPSREQVTAAGLAAVTILLGVSLALVHVVKTERYVGQLGDELRRLAPEAQVIDELVARLAANRRTLAAIESAEQARIPALPVLQELTETLPASAWLQALAMDRQGVELTGQADGASALIPLLEASPRLERVEFTSPVTRTQSKEQFRVRAAWEKER